MIKQLLSLFVSVILSTLNTFANSGSYYASGNFLFPLQETTIAVRSEVLSISICDDGYATVDVLYTFFNNGPTKTIDMAFESPLPYNTDAEFSFVGKHPHISNFTTTLNGQSLKFRSAVVVGSSTDINNFKTFDPKKWRADEDFNYGENYITNGQDKVEVTAYGYLFKATFKQGLNTLHHSYRYQVSKDLSANFEIPYILQPCTRWANHQVDDFTLRISTPLTAKHFYVPDDVLQQMPFTVVNGKGKVRAGVIPAVGDESATHYQEISLRNGMVECHVKNFKPDTELRINSADLLRSLLYSAEKPLTDMQAYYNRGWIFTPMVFTDDDAMLLRVFRNLPYADRGYVFSDKQLRQYFESEWWYMPDPAWKMSTDGFTKTDWRFINELSKEISE